MLKQRCSLLFLLCLLLSSFTINAQEILKQSNADVPNTAFRDISALALDIVPVTLPLIAYRNEKLHFEFLVTGGVPKKFKVRHKSSLPSGLDIFISGDKTRLIIESHNVLPENFKSFTLYLLAINTSGNVKREFFIDVRDREQQNQNFSLSVDPPSLDFKQRAKGTYQLSALGINGFSGPIRLRGSVPVANIFAQFENSSGTVTILPGERKNIFVELTGLIAQGNYTVTIFGTATLNGVEKTVNTSFIVRVIEPPATKVEIKVTPDFLTDLYAVKADGSAFVDEIELVSNTPVSWILIPKETCDCVVSSEDTTKLRIRRTATTKYGGADFLISAIDLGNFENKLLKNYHFVQLRGPIDKGIAVAVNANAFSFGELVLVTFMHKGTVGAPIAINVALRNQSGIADGISLLTPIGGIPAISGEKQTYPFFAKLPDNCFICDPDEFEIIVYDTNIANTKSGNSAMFTINK